MPRTVDEWIGRSDDTPAPPRVRLRVWEREGGLCHRCERKIPPGDAWIIEHRIALINSGENAESNLCLTCSWCKPAKDAEDVALKSRVARKKAKHLGIEKPKSRLPFSRTSPFKKRLDGTVVRRDGTPMKSRGDR